MRLNVNLQPRAPLAGPQDVLMLGRPGRPVAMQKFIQNRINERNRALRGMGRLGDGSTAANILTQASQIASSSFITPAMLANQAAAIQNECSVDPSSPACAVGVATGYGYNPGADALNALQSYCRNNPTDATSCNADGTPLSQYAQQAQKITFSGQAQPCQTGQFWNGYTCVISTGGGSGTQGGGGSVMTVTPKAPTNTVAPSQTNVTTSNTTGSSGQATGNLINGQPAAGSNINPQLLTATTDYTPYLLAVAAVAVLMMVSK